MYLCMYVCMYVCTCMYFQIQGLLKYVYVIDSLPFRLQQLLRSITIKASTTITILKLYFDGQVLKGYFTANRNCSTAELEREVELSLGHPDLLKEIAIAILTASIDEVLNRALYCLLTLLSSYSHGRAVAEVCIYVCTVCMQNV